jgi:hypothetical protein
MANRMAIKGTLMLVVHLLVEPICRARTFVAQKTDNPDNEIDHLSIASASTIHKLCVQT